ncbi:MAG: phage terminase large subunit [Planctomycetota bacterium]
MTRAKQLVEAANVILSERRRFAASKSPRNFASIYLPHHFQLEPSPLHTELFEMLHHVSTSRGSRIAVAAPRGHAKSTVASLAYVLWSVLFGGERYVLLVAATAEQAKQQLKHIRDEAESNDLLKADFPHLDPGVRRPSPLRRAELEMPGGTLIKALGAHQQIRGLRNRESRPSLIVADDLESPEHIRHEEQRIKLREWFGKTLLHAGDTRTNVVVVGTVLHYDSLLAGLLDPKVSPGWSCRKYRALISPPEHTDLWLRWESIYNGHDHWKGETGPAAARAMFRKLPQKMSRGAEVLWPEKETLQDLYEMRVREGRAAFDSEKQNEPLDPEQCLFPLDSLTYWDDEFDNPQSLLAALGDGVKIRAAWDPSVGGGTRSDYSAIVVVAYKRSTKTSYVLQSDLTRDPPDKRIEALIEYDRIFRLSEIVVESNGFQELIVKDLKGAFRERGRSVRVITRKNAKAKRERIELMQPAIASGAIRFSRKHAVLLEQLRTFPLGKHDDGPDALELATRTKHTPKPEILLI